MRRRGAASMAPRPTRAMGWGMGVPASGGWNNLQPGFDTLDAIGHAVKPGGRGGVVRHLAGHHLRDALFDRAEVLLEVAQVISHAGHGAPHLKSKLSVCPDMALDTASRPSIHA